MVMPEQTIENASAIDATVNPESPLVTVYNLDGRMIAVPEADLATWIRDGWSREALDPKAEFEGLRVMADATVTAIGAAVEGVTADGYVDTADRAFVAQAGVALAEFVSQGTKVLRALEARYPARNNSEPVALINDTGGRTEVDPGQVETYLAQGWSRAEE